MKLGHLHGRDALMDAREDLSSFLRDSSSFMETDEDAPATVRYKLARIRKARRQDTAPAIEAMRNEND